MPKEEALRPEDAVAQTALPSGEAKGPVSGYLHFAYKGKTKSLKTLELIYEGPAGSTMLRLAP